MRMRTLVLGVATLLASASALADTGSYADQQRRAIKSLSPEEVDDLLAGRGMGLAKAGELNRHPGPRHVLDLARELALTAEQTRAVRAIFDRMEAEARKLGAEIVAREAALDRRFAAGTVELVALGAETETIGALQGRLRAVHLAAHVETRDVLTPAQVARYDELRGYAGHQGHGHGQRHG